MIATAWPLIELDSVGVAWIAGTRTKVIQVALDRIAYHWDAEEIRRQHPTLSLGQIYSALAYYYEHQAECDRQIEEHHRDVDGLRLRTENRGLQARLRASRRP